MKIIAICLFVAVALLALAAEKFVDDKLAAKAEVVLRVKRLTPGEGSKYLWYRVGLEKVSVLSIDNSASLVPSITGGPRMFVSPDNGGLPPELVDTKTPLLRRSEKQDKPVSGHGYSSFHTKDQDGPR